MAVREALESGVMRANILTQIRLASGLVLFLKYSVAPLYSEDKEIIGAVLAFHDDTLTQFWSTWSNFGLGVDPAAVFEDFDRGLFVVNYRRSITAFNRTAQELTGFRPEEVLGRYCWEVFQADRCKKACLLKATLEDGVTRKDQDVRIKDSKGRWLNLLISTSPIRNKRDVIVGGVETFQSLGVALDRRAEKIPLPGEVEIIGHSPAMQRLLDMLPDVAASEATVVLEGESGTGKDLFAQAIHLKSPRAQGPFVAFSCSALVETLIESELFGHVKGAFTGAISNKVGRFEMAKGGTLFLDEIGELKLELQTKLLRVLESKVFERVGSSQPIPMEARIIAATSRNLVEEVRRGRFRMDLLYRLRTVPFYLPPLRERRQDIPLLVNHCLARLNRKYQKAGARGRSQGHDPLPAILLAGQHPGTGAGAGICLGVRQRCGDHQRPVARAGIPPGPGGSSHRKAQPVSLGERTPGDSESPAQGPGQPGGRGPVPGHQPQLPVAQDEALRPPIIPGPAVFPHLSGQSACFISVSINYRLFIEFQ